MVQLWSQHICCLVLITTPDSYRKSPETPWAKESSQRQRQSWQSRGDHALPIAAARKLHRKLHQSSSCPHGSRNHPASPCRSPGSGAPTTESRSRPCLKLLETPHHGQYKPVQIQQRRYGLGDWHSSVHGQPQGYKSCCTQLHLQPAWVLLFASLLTQTINPSPSSTTTIPRAGPTVCCTTRVQLHAPEQMPSAQVCLPQLHPTPDIVNQQCSLSWKVTGGYAELGGEKVLTPQQTP